MRIGLVCPYSLTIPGGVQGQVMALSRSLRKSGHNVRVLAPCDGPPPDSNVIPLGNSVPTASNGAVAPLAPDLSAAFRTVRVLRHEDFDVLHIHEPFCPGPTLTALLFAPAPVIGTFHRAGLMKHHELLTPITKSWVGRMKARVAVSEDAKATASEMYGGDYDVLFNGVEIDRFRNAERIPTEGPTIFFIGRHEPRKGLNILLEAFESLPSEARLWIGGDGPDTDALTNRYRDDHRITWLGRLSDRQAASYMASADVFCAPSLVGESFGVVLLEAMAASTVVVASDIPGYRNVATNDSDAILVPAQNAAALAEALWKTLSNAPFSDSLREAGERRVASFSIELLATKYLEYYERIRRR